jgi:hypothetical protein
MLDWFLKPIPGPHQVYCFLTSSPNAVVEPSQSHAGHPADRRGTRGLDAHRGMKPRRYSGHCPTMRSGSSRAVWTRKTRPLHEYAADRLYADPAKAARRILEIVNALSQFRAASTSRKSTSRFYRGNPAEYGAGLKLAIERGWLKMHESGTFVTFTSAGAELFA